MKAAAKMALLAILVGAAAGCGKGNSVPELAVQKQELGQLYARYMYFLKANGRPPTELSQLEEDQVLYAAGMQAVREGKYEVAWGVSNKDAGTILAYEPRAAEEGGVVLMADGTVKTMTAAQFKNAKPAP